MNRYRVMADGIILVVTEVQLIQAGSIHYGEFLNQIPQVGDLIIMACDGCKYINANGNIPICKGIHELVPLQSIELL